MPQSLVCNYVHIVFSTRERKPIIRESEQERVWSYLGAIAANHGCNSVAVGGMRDHAHLLLMTPSDLSISKAVNLLKSNSSKWMNERGFDFAWQRGYSAFSVSKSNVRAVERYIRNQAEHHKKRDFKAELLELLKRHEMGYDERYLFD